MQVTRLKRPPVRIYRSENQWGLAMPLPGMEPEDIHVTVEGRRVTINGRERGPNQHDMDLLRTEWTVGPYHRKIMMPERVDGSLANATYGNGILVLTLPKLTSGKATRTEFTLQTMESARGSRVGHMGHDIQKTTTKQYLERVARLHADMAV